MKKPLLKVEIKYEHDVVLARQRARLIAALLGFDPQDQVRIATSVSELARNAFQYAGGGKVEFALNGDQGRLLQVTVQDHGKGIADVNHVLSGRYQSTTGMGVGIIGTRRLMDEFSLKSNENGTQVQIGKYFPKHAKTITTPDIIRITDKLASDEAYNPFQEIQRQNQELLVALDEVQKQRGVLTDLNRELEETNRGVVALYAELDQRADYLKHASEMKTQFLSNMTHEFRTPLNSILSISQMLLDRLDGELTSEQEKQVSFIQAGAKSLAEMVNDLLDLAKVEAGKVIIRPNSFDAKDMFGVLRGMLKPLLESNHSVMLAFDEPENIPQLVSDEGKVSQILRNFISNGLKYTERGEVRVSVGMRGDSHVAFAVSDTGIGISETDHERIFEEFTQVEGAIQQKMKGTGLGLPLSRKLAELLGGHVEVVSEPGMGSTFSLIIPVQYNGPQEALYSNEPLAFRNRYERVLVIDDNPADRYIVKKLIAAHVDIVVEAANGSDGLIQAETVRPSVIILDLAMPDMKGEEVLKRLKEIPHTRDIPVIIHTSKVLRPKERAALEAKADAVLAKSSTNQDSILKELERIRSREPQKELSHAG